MNLNLKNPLIIFDIESTGLDVSKDRIVEISALKIFPDGREDLRTRRLNPGIPISPEATTIHGIRDEDVKDCPIFKAIAKNLATFLEGCDLAGYNSLKFDLPLLAEEFLRVGISIDFHKRKMIDVQNIFHRMEQRTLVAAYKFYCNSDLEKAHSAEADAIATYEVLKAQLDKYSDLQNEVDFLAEFSTRTRNLDYAGRIVEGENKEASFNFGKYKGRKVREVLVTDPAYYSWMMNGDFTLDTKRVLTEIRLSIK
ncbi:MAG: 3'-5' exonuclease [Prevotellaceae bacterium]|jgi:DNA polymerase-3 subunit epsilon|nr:3'-5' exonuclease [Prevotellaceae bacterium]